MEDYLYSLAGGILIGLASILMLLLNGKILGISGIVGGIVQKSPDKKHWRFLFLLGLLSGGVLLALSNPSLFNYGLSRSPWAVIVAGLLVGYGTRLGSGCTSGHGICGISRMSPRSLMATLTFIGFGAATVLLINHLLGGRI